MLTRSSLAPFQPRPDPFLLRPYQQSANQAILDHHARGEKRVVIELPPGAGKTAVLAVAARSLIQSFDNEGCVLVTVPWLHLVKQTYKDFLGFFSPRDLGVIQGSTNMLGRRITIASVATMAQPERLASYAAHLQEPLRGIFDDEAHRAICDSMLHVHHRLDPHGEAEWLGMSATPYRSDKKSLELLYSDGLIYSEDFLDLILQDYLVDIVSYDIDTNLDISPAQLKAARTLADVGTSDTEVENLLVRTNRYEKGYSDWMSLTSGTMKTLLFAQSVKDAYRWRAYLQARGVQAEVIESHLGTKNRAHVMESFKLGGPTQLLINYDVLSTGANLPYVQCIMIGRIMGIGPWTQCVGRGLRLCPEIGKTKCLLLNLVDQHHTLMSMGRLLGTLLYPGASVKRTLETLLREQTSSDRADQPIEMDLGALLETTKRRSYDVFTGGGWTVNQITGEASKSYAAKGLGTLSTIKVLTGSYQVLYTSPAGAHRWLSKEPLPAHEAMVRGHQEMARREQEALFRGEAAKPLIHQQPQVRDALAQPIREEQWAYLRKRKVSGIGRKGESFEMVQTRYQLTQQDYLDADALLKEHKGARVPGQGYVQFDAQRRKMRI